ncbi:hypothetical protein HGA91_01865 [candidate division WWE3 bacterium]|nr:hypothetical protein [candidate division WWE3 bacterium]
MPEVWYRFMDGQLELRFTGLEPFALPMRLVLGGGFGGYLFTTGLHNLIDLYYLCHWLAAIQGTPGEMIAAFSYEYDPDNVMVQRVAALFKQYRSQLKLLRNQIDQRYERILGATNPATDPGSGAIGIIEIDGESYFEVNATRLEGSDAFSASILLPVAAMPLLLSLKEQEDQGPFGFYLQTVTELIGDSVDMLIWLFHTNMFNRPVLELLEVPTPTRIFLDLQYQLVQQVMEVIRSSSQ